MKTILNFPKGAFLSRFKVSSTLLSGLILLLISSCQKNEMDMSEKVTLQGTEIMFSTDLAFDGSIIYYGHKIFSRSSGAPFVETQKMENRDFKYFDSLFVLKIQNGVDKKSRVSSAEISIDGNLVFGTEDFSKNVSVLTKELNTLSPESVIEVKLNGTPGSFIDLWIEGKIKDGLIKDADGNFYKTVKIGDQFWMAENLKTTRYRNGDLIGTTTPTTLNISNQNMPKYQWASGGNENNVSVDGRLYTWYAITDNRNICPVGWHVPTDAEWTKLTGYLSMNGYGYGGTGDDIAKSLASSTNWIINTTAGNPGNDQLSNDKSGFNALPAGYRVSEGTFTLFGTFAGWWSSNESNIINAWYRGIYSYSPLVSRANIIKKDGGSIRCIKDLN